MKKIRTIRKKWLVAGIAGLLVLILCGSLIMMKMMEVSAATVDYDNGETPVPLTSKADILKNIKEAGGNLTVLEIVPYDAACTLQVLGADSEFLSLVKAKAAELYNGFSWNNGVIAGTIAYQHPFKIIKNSDGSYTVDYPNFFVNALFADSEYSEYKSYFSTHIDVRTVSASKLTDSDLAGVDMVYISGSVENGEITNFYNYLHGISGYNESSTPTGAYSYSTSTGNYTQYNSTDSQRVGYNSFHKNSYGQYVTNDISWSMADKLIRYIKGGTTTTTKNGFSQPVPVIMNLGNTYAFTKDSNMWKLCNLLAKTTGNTASGAADGTFSYQTVLNNIATASAPPNIVSQTYSRNMAVSFSAGNIYRFDSAVSLTYTMNNNNVVSLNVDYYTGSGGTYVTGNTTNLTGGSYVRFIRSGSQYYLYAFDSAGSQVNSFKVVFNSNGILPVNINSSFFYRVALSAWADTNFYNTNLNENSAATGNILTAGYKINSGYYTTWDNSSNPYTYLFDTQSYGKFHVYNYVFITNNNMSSTLFNVNGNGAISDDGSATLRGVDTVNGQYYVSSYIRYLFGMDKADLVSYNKTINVLEIEPCRDFMYSYNTSMTASEKTAKLTNIKKFAAYVNFKGYSSLTTASYEALMADQTAPKINFACVSTQEFNGMNQDLVEKYDVIVMGSQTGLMNTDTSGKTIYNDTALDGYVYLAFGDLIKVKSVLLGFFASDYTAVSSSVVTGAGFTPVNTKSGSMTTGLNAGTKTIFGKGIQSLWIPGLYSQLQSINGTYFVPKDVNAAFANTTSQSSFYGNTLGNTRFSGNDITAKKKNELLAYIKSGQAVILADNVASSQTDTNGGIVYPTSNLYSFISSAKSSTNVIKASEATAKLSTLLAEDVLNITSCKMLYDKNLDGVNEALVPEQAYDAYGLLKSQSILANVKSFTYDVSFVSNPGDTYTVKLILDKNTDGLYNEEPSTDDKNEVFYTRTLTATAASTALKFNINLPEGYNGMLSWRFLVQETKTASGNISRQSVDGYTTVTGEKKSINVLQILPDSNSATLNMKTDPTFTSLLTKATAQINYNINILTMTADQFEAVFAANPYKAGVDYDTEKNYLKANTIGMVVIGFQDMYGTQDISNDNGALDCLVDYMNKGNSVLFTHDTVSFSPSVNSRTQMNGNSIALGSNGDKWGVDFTRVLRDYLGMDRYGVTRLPSFSDTAALAAAGIPKTLAGTYLQDIQGYTDTILYRMAYNTNFVNARASNGVYTLTALKNDKNYGPTGLITTNTVESINVGQITKYPYNTVNAQGTLAVATTHAQYFQLDMEDKDVVVWYTLAGADNTYNGDRTKDAGNNYYIYSKGNITYSGAGHSTMNVSDELQLFVNTLVKAVVAGNFKPEISVTNAATLRTSDSYVLYPNSLDNSIEVQFVARDDDMANRDMVSNSYTKEEDILAHIGRFNSGAVYWVDKNGNEKVLVNYKYGTSDVVLNGEKTSFTLYDPFAGVANVQAAYNAGTALQKNMYDCYQEYLTAGVTNLKIQVSDSYGETGTSHIKISEHELFNLD